MANPSNIDLNKYTVPVVLTDGSILQLRPIRPDDVAKLQALFYRLSPKTVYLRFHHVLKQMSKEEASRFCNVDYVDAFALVATLGEGDSSRIIAVGRYYRLPARDMAEVAFLVEDIYQGKGIATLLLEHLSRIARENGIHAFVGEVLTENIKMLQVLEESGFQLSQKSEHGVCQVTLNIAPTEAAAIKSAGREKTATVASLITFIRPQSIAVIGASRREGSIGNKIFRNILHEGFTGTVYPVNPTTEVVAAVRAYPSVLSIPGAVDLAVIVVPAPNVGQVIHECGQKGVRGAVIISAGFAETGEEGRQQQANLMQTAQSYGIRIIGPNCMGVLNTDQQVRMNATFSTVFPPGGNIAFCSQSGALGLAVLEYAQELNIGLSDFVSIGNRVDVSSNDLMQYWQDDPATDVILLYLESFGNPRKFARIARSVSQTKPIVAVKSGRTSAGSRAAASHTGALATAEATSDALFKQAGIIRVDTLEQLFDVANILAHQPLPPGKRVAILTNGGGPGILTADACADMGLELPELSPETLSGLMSILPKGSGYANPIDMTAEGSAEQYRQSLLLLAKDSQIDIAIVIFIPPIVTQPEVVAQAIVETSQEFRRLGKTLVASFMGIRGSSLQLNSPDGGAVPSFVFPESTAHAIAKACEYRGWLSRPKGSIPDLSNIDKDRAKAIISAAFERSAAMSFWLDARDTVDLLEAYGIRTVPSIAARSAEEAAHIAGKIGFPVAVKLLSSTITHKTEVDGVVLDLKSATEVKQAFSRLKDKLTALGREQEMEGVIVQEMVKGGVEIIVGVTQDPSFGPLMLFGMGGIYTELLEDTALRIHPLTDLDAREMVQSVRVYRLLKGWRGAKPSDINALEELLLRVSAMVEDLPQISELDLNPVKVLEVNEGYRVVDFRMKLSQGPGGQV